MTGSRCITTFRKLPTSSARKNALLMSSPGLERKTSRSVVR
jgi:hypothetical protein